MLSLSLSCIHITINRYAIISVVFIKHNMHDRLFANMLVVNIFWCEEVTIISVSMRFIPEPYPPYYKGILEKFSEIVASIWMNP